MRQIYASFLFISSFFISLTAFAQQTYVPDDNFEAYLEANGMGNGIANDDYVTTANISSVTFLDVSNENIADLTGIEAFTALTELRCYQNNLTTLDLSGNPSLTKLFCFLNSLTNLNVSANTGLVELSCSSNNLMSLDVSNNTDLEELVCHTNSLTALDVSNNTALDLLNCFNNSLTTLDVSNNTALTNLECKYNSLTALDVSNNPDLTSLDIAHNNITTIDVSANTNLQQVFFNHNSLSSLDISALTGLYYLYCNNNSLSTLDLSSNTNFLRRVICSYNNLTTLEVCANTALRELDCRNNSLTELDVSNLPVLTKLHCENNSLLTLNVKNGNNTSFSQFFAANNPSLTCIEVDDAAYSTTNWTNIDPASSFNINCGVTPTKTWTGASNTDWFNASNWAPRCFTPSAADNVIVPDVSGASGNFPQIVGPDTARAKAITVDAGATVEVANLNDGRLEIHGDLDNSGDLFGTGTISFAAGDTQTITGSLSFPGIIYVPTGSTVDANGNLTLEDGACLMHGFGTPFGGGEVLGNIHVQRQGATFSSAFNFWSSSVQGQNVSVLGGSYYYNPAAATDLGAGLEDGWINASGNMTQGLGYAAQGAGLVTFTGSPSNAPTGTFIEVTIDKPLTTVSNDRNPWNLVGNPFPSALDASAFQALNGPSGNNLITGALYFWEDDNSGGSGYSLDDFATWNVVGVNPRFDPSSQGSSFNGYIASGQSFFVEKINNGPSQLQFKNSMRSTVDNHSFFRRAPIERFYLGTFSPNGIYNEALVAFLDDATDGLDLAYDAKKFKGNDELALGTKLNGESFAIQAFEPLTGDLVIPVALDAGSSGNYQFKMMAIEELDESVVVLLEDADLNVFHNFRLDSVYNFSATAAQDINRFSLHFNAPLELTAIETSCEGGDGELTIEQPGSKSWDFELLDHNGMTVTAQSGFNGVYTFQHLESGNYSARFTDASGYTFDKDFIIEAKDIVTAAFNTSATTVYENEPVTFNSTSLGVISHEWDFGDGSPVSTDANPTHVYDQVGIYEVTLNASSDDCTEEAYETVEVLKLSTRIDDLNNGDLKVYGVNDLIYVELLSDIDQSIDIAIFDVLGKQVHFEKLSASHLHSINFEHAGGLYIVKAMVNSKISTHKVVLAR